MGRSGWRDAAARMGVSSAMLVDMDGAIHITRELKGRLRFSEAERVGEVVP